MGTLMLRRASGEGRKNTSRLLSPSNPVQNQNMPEGPSIVASLDLQGEDTIAVI